MKQNRDKTYFSAEFQLNNPGIFFQFRLRQAESEPMFALVQQDSKAMAAIEPGAVIPVIYHYKDKTIPAEKRPTRIKSVTDGSAMGFKNHFMVALDIQE